MILGVVSMLSMITVIGSACVIPLALPGLICGFVALRRPQRRGVATAGVIMNGAALVLVIVAIAGLSLLVSMIAALVGATGSP
jgi:hypothetical protein